MTIKDILEGIVSVTVIGGGLMAFLSYILSNKFATKNDLKEHEEKCQSEICKKIDTLSGDIKKVTDKTLSDSKDIAIALTKIADKLGLDIPVP